MQEFTEPFAVLLRDIDSEVSAVTHVHVSDLPLHDAGRLELQPDAAKIVQFPSKEAWKRRIQNHLGTTGDEVRILHMCCDSVDN